MNCYRNFKPMTGLFILLAPVIANAQWYNRLEVGYSYVMATAQYSGSSGYYDNYGNHIGDTNSTRNIKATAGIGYDIGLTVPLKRVGPRSMWGLSIHFVYNGFIWENLNQAYSVDGSYFNVSGFPDLYGATIQIGAPIGIDYKFGPDAVCSKKYRVGFSLGAGVMPTYSLTELVGVDNAGAGVGSSFNPYVKAEVALFGGYLL